MTNLLIALKNLIMIQSADIEAYSKSSNRANSMGDALEIYIRDLFCGSSNAKREEKDLIYNNHFSYLGNQNNPPDLIIKGGDALEVKKIESLRSGIALNSSYPKDKLYVDSPMITKDCRLCEAWKEKDIIYCIGIIKNNRLIALWFVYGNCYAANKDIYERIKTRISTGLNELDGVELSDTEELGRVNKVDPLGITYLRIRGMWGIENPAKVFDYIAGIESNKELTVNAIMLKEKYDSFPEKDRVGLEKLVNSSLSISDIKIKSPNNPAKLLEAKLIKFSK
ncbi:MAG: type II site-specific deoxyribonuclease, type II restriction enzyme [Candidatus Peregrinibacteria bacterium GW2011_GWF2_38_29]|nr:MAG: type II site-specific deoxyribonuclease, type II restriction enzyme [Candidatus Peregrinibacteria bacterium GW2011_GWF2_38_29]HBB03033.1 restriction endonuclease [Candidatus Peregrinibacteria bacterium]